MSAPLSPASAHAVRFGVTIPWQANGRCAPQRLSNTPAEVEPEQAALLVPVEGYGTAEPIDDHLRRVPVCENVGNNVGGEEAKAQEPRHIAMCDSFLLCDFSGRPGAAVQ